MIRLIIILYILSIGTTFAGENIHFLNKPDYLTDTDVMIAIGHTAKNRKYTVPNVINDTLRISLVHRGYNVVLDFSVSGNEVVYNDLTTYLDEYEEEDGDSSSNGQPRATPASWIRSLNSNSENLFLLIKNIKENYKK